MPFLENISSKNIGFVWDFSKWKKKIICQSSMILRWNWKFGSEILQRFQGNHQRYVIGCLKSHIFGYDRNHQLFQPYLKKSGNIMLGFWRKYFFMKTEIFKWHCISYFADLISSLTSIDWSNWSANIKLTAALKKIKHIYISIF